MKNIHILPTDKPSRLIIYSTLLNEFRLLNKPIEDWKHKKNIYITSDEEIKEGDWHLSFLRDKFEVINYLPNGGYRTECLGKEVCKIILTTDQDLIKDGVQAAADEFLEWFVKNPSCEEVEVVKTAPIRPFGSLYKIIIPKEEPKKKHIVMIVGDKVNEEPKQETLEEAAKRYSYGGREGGHRTPFLEGVKWQQKRSYSEEDMKRAFYYGYCCENKYGIEVTFNDWFIKFKNK